jgi:penicillin-binding protein 2
LLYDPKPQQAASMGFSQEHLDYIHAAMKDVVNGPGTAGRAKLPIENVLLAGKTGTAQVVGLNISKGKGGQWKYRDHGHFICFAPFDKPRYACAVTIEHGGGSSSAYPIARDVMTFLFDPQKAMDVLLEMETGWGGTPQQRMESKYRSFAAKYGGAAPEVPEEEADQPTAGDEKPEEQVEQPVLKAAQSPPPEPDSGRSAAEPNATPSPDRSAPEAGASPASDASASPSP